LRRGGSEHGETQADLDATVERMLALTSGTPDVR
jgi:hypothetical protein